VAAQHYLDLTHFLGNCVDIKRISVHNITVLKFPVPFTVAHEQSLLYYFCDFYSEKWAFALILLSKKLISEESCAEVCRLLASIDIIILVFVTLCTAGLLGNVSLL
jgi:hypothetical protein